MVVLAGKVVLVTRAAAARGPTADSINRITWKVITAETGTREVMQEDKDDTTNRFCIICRG